MNPPFDAKNILFTDESVIRQYGTGVRRTMWIEQNVEQEDWPTIPRVHSGGCSRMFWGCVSRFGFGPIIPLQGTLKSAEYCNILERIVAPYVRYLEETHGVRMILQQDNAPCHRSKRVSNKIAELGLTTFKWPASSPDMNPIENAWAVWKSNRQATYGYATNVVELEAQSVAEWRKLSPNYAKELVYSFEKRLRAVIRHQGRPIPY
jgi:transposase